jgi:uncharacterized membrane protein
MSFADAIEIASMAVEAAGVTIILVGITLSSIGYLNSLRRGNEVKHAYRAYRVSLGRVILLGLEFLVAADIIRTVGVHRTTENVIMLGAIVAIRTFLSLALDVELEGRWPWRHQQNESSSDPVLAKDPADD